MTRSEFSHSQHVNAAQIPFHLQSQNFGGQSMISDLKRVLVRAPDSSFAHADPELWHYTEKINYEKAQQEHDYLMSIFTKEGVEVIYHKEPLPRHADAIYVHDPVLITNWGAILLRMGKELRRGEEAAMKNTLVSLNIPILHELSEQSFAEGGDTLWLDEKTLIVGRGFRTNLTAIQELAFILNPLGIQVEYFDLPYDLGERACLHLQSFISLVDEKKAIVYRKLMPSAFYQLLRSRNFELIDVPDEEYLSMGCNVLCIRPGVCVALENNQITIKKLRDAGCKVHTYDGANISLKAEGGPTCLTRPLLRL